MASLFADLTSKPQRETAGSDAASRFDYQKDWAFCQLMRKHAANESYLVAFEFHDDVLFLTPAENPAAAEFTQVKTSSGAAARTLSSLTSRPKGKSSILGKMFANFDGVCASHDVKVTLASNNAFEFAGGDLCAKNLEKKFREKLLEKMKAEIPDFDTARLDRLHFHVTGVSLEAMQSFLEGEAVELFCSKFGEDHGLNIRTWIRLIKSEITRKNNYPSNKISSAADLVDRKCVAQSFVEETLAEIHSKAKQLLDVSAIVTHMTATDAWSSVDVIRFQKHLPEATADFFNPLNKEAHQVSDIIRSKVRDSNGVPMDLADFFIIVVQEIQMDAKLAEPYKKTDYIRAIGALVYYDEI
jgi:hypothetical protein